MAMLYDLTRQAYLESLQTILADRPRAYRVGELGFVYVLKGVRYVKIGYSRQPEGRMRTLQDCVPFQLELLLSLPGTTQTETAIHNVLDRYRSRGDWFHHNSYVSDGIRGLQSITPEEIKATERTVRNVPIQVITS